MKKNISPILSLVESIKSVPSAFLYDSFMQMYTSVFEALDAPPHSLAKEGQGTLMGIPSPLPLVWVVLRTIGVHRRRRNGCK